MKNLKNIKLKYYLRGLGTGIVITSLVLTISFNVRSCTAKNNVPEETTTEDTTKEISSDKENNIENTTSKDDKSEEKSSSKDDKSEEKSTSKDNEAEEKQSSKDDESEEKTTEKDTEENTTEKQSEDKSEEEPASDTPLTNQKVTLNVTRGMASDTVAALLEDAGAVDSAYEFNKYLYQMGYERIIRVGTYEIEVGMSYEEIARMITRAN